MTITNDILAGTGHVYLTTGANVAEATTAKIVGTSLGMTAANGISANSATNNVTNLAASTAAGAITYQDADALTVVNLVSSGNYLANAATTGITTGAGNGNVDLKSGSLTITNDILAGTGTVYLTSAGTVLENGTGKIVANTLGINATGAITATNANNVANLGAVSTTGSISR